MRAGPNRPRAGVFRHGHVQHAKENPENSGEVRLAPKGGFMTREEVVQTLSELFTTGEHPRLHWESVLERAGGLSRLARCSEMQLQMRFELSPRRARQVCAVFRLGREALLHAERGGEALCSPADVFAYLAPRIGWPESEEFWVLGFNTRQQPLHLSLVAKGTADQVSLSVGSVFRELLLHGSVRGLCCHTHPSGDPSPSAADRILTARLVETGRLLGLPIVDHIVLGQGEYYSLADEGDM